MATSKITIQVTKEDISKDRKDRMGEGDRCMLAKAIIRRLDLRPGEDGINVDYDSFTLGYDGQIEVPFDEETSRKIRAWDEQEKIEPFETTVEIPADWRQRLNGIK